MQFKFMALKRRRSIALIAGLALILATSQLFAQSTLGTISGLVTGDDGGPLSGVRVTASAALPKTLGVSEVLATGSTRGFALSTSTGSFILENLPPGAYTLCAQGSETHLDPCHWSQTALTVSVAANEKLNSIKLKLVRGALLQIHLADSKNILDSGPNSANQPHVLIGVSTQAGHFYPALNAGNNATGRNRKLLIPLHMNLELKIVSTHVALADSLGKALPDSYSVPFRIDAAVPQVLNFTVTGSR